MKFGLTLFLVSIAAGQSIPKVQRETLAGSSVNLPADLRGKAGYFIVGFSRESSPQSKAWGIAVGRDYTPAGKFEYYQIAVLAGVPGLIRGLVMRSIRGDVPADQRGHFIAVFENEAAWKAAAQFKAADDAYVLLVDGTGRVVARASGKFTEAAWKGLQREAAGL